LNSVANRFKRANHEPEQAREDYAHHDYEIIGHLGSGGMEEVCQANKSHELKIDGFRAFGFAYILIACVELERQIWGAASIKRGNMLNTAV